MYLDSYFVEKGNKTWCLRCQITRTEILVQFIASLIRNENYQLSRDNYNFISSSSAIYKIRSGLSSLPQLLRLSEAYTCSVFVDHCVFISSPIPQK